MQDAWISAYVRYVSHVESALSRRDISGWVAPTFGEWLTGFGLCGGVDVGEYSIPRVGGGTSVLGVQEKDSADGVEVRVDLGITGNVVRSSSRGNILDYGNRLGFARGGKPTVSSDGAGSLQGQVHGELIEATRKNIDASEEEKLKEKSRGKWFEHKKKKKERKRISRQGGGVTQESSVPEWRRKLDGESGQSVTEKRLREKSELQSSLEKKWAAENELRQFEAERKLRVLKSQDEDTIIRMQRAQVMRTTEKCKVDTERAFKSLLKSGNVAGAPAGGMGSVETVVSDGSIPSLTRSNGDTISPDSSASMQEFRKCQKDLLDAEKKLAQNEEAFERLAIIYPRECAAAREVAEMKTAYTLDSNGEAEYEVDGVLGPDGKIHVDNLNDIHGPNYAHKKYDEFRESMGEPYEY